MSPTRKDEIFTNKMYCRKRPQKRCFTKYNMHAVKILFSEKNIALCCALGHKPFPKNWYILKTRYIHVQYNVWINPLGLFLWHCDKIASVYFIPDLQKKAFEMRKVYIYIYIYVQGEHNYDKYSVQYFQVSTIVLWRSKARTPPLWLIANRILRSCS